MEIVSVPVASFTKEDEKIYQNWFNFVDSGAIFCSRLKTFFICSVEQLFVFAFFDEITEKKCNRCVFFWLRCADGDGRITGNDAIKLFSLSNLSKPELKQVSVLLCNCSDFCQFFWWNEIYNSLFWIFYCLSCVCKVRFVYISDLYIHTCRRAHIVIVYDYMVVFELHHCVLLVYLLIICWLVICVQLFIGWLFEYSNLFRSHPFKAWTQAGSVFLCNCSDFCPFFGVEMNFMIFYFEYMVCLPSKPFLFIYMICRHTYT